LDNFDARKKTNQKSELPAEPVVHWRLDQWFPNIPAPVKEKLKVFSDEMVKFNKTLNLVSPKTVPHSDIIHFSDSILAVQLIYNTCKPTEIYDFGSGSGFPGIVMALLYPSTKVNLVESDPKKADYLKHCVNTLGLTNAKVLAVSLDTLPANSVKYGMSRGLSTISKSILSARKIFSKGGTYFHLKSEEWASELSDIPTQLCSFWQPGLVGEYKLPVGEVKFAVVKTDKISD
jgi:16S rRNA (guanine527-N7)-methyltransferase